MNQRELNMKPTGDLRIPNAVRITLGKHNYSVYRVARDLEGLRSEGVEGCTVQLAQDNDIYRWLAVVFGPPDSIYQGGYFKMIMSFPNDYPYSPPSVRFITRIFHPNIGSDGQVHIPILELPPFERSIYRNWNPTWGARTVLSSIVQLFIDPDLTCVPVNLSAAAMCRKRKVLPWLDSEFLRYTHQCVHDSVLDAARDNVKVPMTVQEYAATRMTTYVPPASALDESDFDYEDYSEEDESVDTDHNAPEVQDPQEDKSDGDLDSSWEVVTSSDDDDDWHFIN